MADRPPAMKLWWDSMGLSVPFWQTYTANSWQMKAQSVADVLGRLCQLVAYQHAHLAGKWVAQFIGVYSSAKTGQIGENLLSVSDPISSPSGDVHLSCFSHTSTSSSTLTSVMPISIRYCRHAHRGSAVAIPAVGLPRQGASNALWDQLDPATGIAVRYATLRPRPVLSWNIFKYQAVRGNITKAIRLHTFGDPEVLQLEEVPDPQPGPGHVVVRVHAVGVNPVETYIRSGIYPKPPTPYTPGNDGAGVIAALGPDVKQWQAGDRVYIAGSLSGTYAEKSLCLATRVHPLPAPASFAQGAAIHVP
jgi:Alcohol dehydrogenase GroES-like domain